MKDDQEHIDQLFKSLNDRQFEIPEAFLQDLDKRLDNRSKRRRFFLWFLTSFILIGAIGICYSYFFDKSETRSSADKENKLIAKDEYNVRLNEPGHNNQYSIDSSSEEKQAAKKQTNTTENTKSQAKSSHSIQLSTITGKTNDSQIKQSSKLKTTSRKSASEIHQNSQRTRIKPGKNKTAVNVKTSKSGTGNNALLSTGGGEQDQDKITQVSTPDPAAASSSALNPEQEKLPKDSIPETGKDAAITQNTTDTIRQVDSSSTEKNEAKSKASGNNWRKEVQLFAGLGGNTMHDSPKNSDYLAKINQNQSSILAPSFGVNANLSYKKLTFGTGVKYEQTGEKFKVDVKSSELKDSTYSEFIQDTVWVQDSIGNWIPTIHDTTIYYTVQYMDSTWVSRSFRNRYSWISIPLHFGYRFELGEYELIPRIGAVFNFGIASRAGTYPDSSFNNVHQYPPAKFNISYLIQLEARRNLKNCFVFINPYFQSMINPAVSGDVIRRRYSSWGIQFGIGFNL